MKKIISIALLLVMMLSLFAGCAKEDTPDTGSGLDKAKEYLEGMYKSDPVDTPADYTLVGVVRVEGVDYNVEWSADSDKITAKRNDKMVTIDVPENSAEEIKYVLTATISDAEGNKVTTTFNRRIPAAAAAGLTMEEIVELAYQLEDGEVMEGNATLTGVITSVKTPYDPGYQNITVKIQIGELSDKLIECYRLKGEGAADLCVGDTITVTGSLKNYSGTIEFDAGCSLDNVVPGERVQAPEDPKEIMDAAYALEEGKSLPYEATLTGVISEINTPYDSGYKNLSMTIVIEGCEDKPLYCYRAKGEGADTLAVGDTVSVTGYLMNYKGGIQYGAGSIISNIVKGEGGATTDKPSTDTPSTDKPSTDKPSTDKPSTDKPSTDKPAGPSGTAANIANGTYMIVDTKAGTQVAGKCPGTDKTYGYLYDDYTADEKHFTTIYTIKSVGGGKYTIQDCDNRYLGVSGTYKSFQLYTKNEGDSCLWTISTGKNGEHIIKNVSNGRYIDYAEDFNSFGVYLDSELPEDGQVKLVAAKAAEKPSTPDTPSTPDKPTTPSGDTVAVKDGKYVIYVPGYNKALSSTYNGYYNNGVDVTASGSTVSGYGDTEVWTITNNGDGTFCISCGGQKLAMGDSFSSMPLGEKNDKWVAVDAGDGLIYIKNVARELYIEWYADKNNWSAYGSIGEGKEGMFAIKLVAV